MTAKPRVIVAMLGARRHYAVPRLLYEAGMLERFYTDSYIGNKPWLEWLLGTVPPSVRPRGLQRWLGRKDAVLPQDKVTSFEVFGWHYAWQRYRGNTVSHGKVVYAEFAARFNRHVISSYPLSAEVVWGFNGACLELLQWAKSRGMRCIVEQTIAPMQIQHQLLSEELARWPNWQPSLKSMVYPNPLSVREEEEWALADVIVAGSEFVADSMRLCGVSAERIRVVPYGVDSRRFKRIDCSQHTGPLRLLFAGEVGLRKGVPDLLEALRRLGPENVEAMLAGQIALAEDKVLPYRTVADFLGFVPRAKMSELFKWADVFVLPSLVEGSATVIYEALISGLPVITTPNAGSIVRDGVDGFIVPIRDPEALAQAIKRYRDDRDLLTKHQAATAENCERAGLLRYQNDLSALLQEVSTGHQNID